MRSLSSEDSFFSTIEERPSSSLDSEKISAEDLLSILWIGYLLPRIWFGIILRLEFLLVHASNFKPLFLDKICGSSINFPLSGLVPKNGERLWNVNPPQLFSPWFTLLRSISINLIRRIRGMISSLSTGAGTERQHSLIRIRGISLPLLLFFRSGEDLSEREALESLLPLLDLPLLSDFCSDLDLDLEGGLDLDLDLLWI